jgi:predicted AlkP superfamily phosphohydrolase/phosphomutase
VRLPLQTRRIAQTLGSAAASAAILAAEVVLLALYLNPGVSLRREAPYLVLALFLPYALAGSLGLLAIALAGTLLRWPRAPRPPLEYVPWFTTLSLLAVGAAAVLFWVNLWSYRHSIPVEVVRSLVGSAFAVSTAALVLLAVGVDSLFFPLRGRAFAAPLVVLAPAAAIVVPLALRPQPAPQPRPVPIATERVEPVRRVLLVGIDGLGPEMLRDGLEKGNLPAFARLLRRGAHGPLATLRPTEGPPVWTSVVTGRLPRDHGVKSFATYRLRGSRTVYELLPKGAFVRLLEKAGLVATSPVTSASRRSRTLWNALNAYGIATGVVRMWGTYPPERVQGFMLSPYFHLLREEPAQASGTLYPPDLLGEIRARGVRPDEVEATLVSEFLDPAAPEPGDTVPWRRELLERALAPDLTYKRAGAVLRAAYDPPFFATYFYGLDVVGHTFLRYAHPDRFGDVRPEEVRRYGRVLDRYAALLSQWVGEAAQDLRPGEVLFVVSGYGLETVPLWRRLLDGVLGDPPRSGTHAGAPDGYVMAIGDGIKAGATVRGASVVDIAPTVLYLFGLPVARDMEGRVLTEILEEDFARSHPVSFIPSYESLAGPSLAGGTPDELPPLPDEDH